MNHGHPFSRRRDQGQFFQVARFIPGASGANVIHPDGKGKPTSFGEQKGSALAAAQRLPEFALEGIHGIDKVSAFAERKTAEPRDIGRVGQGSADPVF